MGVLAREYAMRDVPCRERLCVCAVVSISTNHHLKGVKRGVYETQKGGGVVV